MNSIDCTYLFICLHMCVYMYTQTHRQRDDQFEREYEGMGGLKGGNGRGSDIIIYAYIF